MKALVINGPNINMLGIREPGIYGSENFNTMIGLCKSTAQQLGFDEIECYQSNHEGDLVDKIQEAYGTVDGIVINPGAYTHYSYAIHDALASVTMPKVEIHISDITAREAFRKISVTRPACDDQIYGKGLEGYLIAIDRVAELRQERGE